MPTVHFDDLSVHERRRLVARVALRTMFTVAMVVAVYLLVPMDRAISAATVTELLLGCLVLFGVITWQVRQIIRSEHPGVRAVEALALTLPVYIPCSPPLTTSWIMPMRQRSLSLLAGSTPCISRSLYSPHLDSATLLQRPKLPELSSRTR